MPTFDFTPLFWWGLPVAAAPLLIHLINLLRHRRVPWAAMEFLLASQRTYRTRVLLRQLLLLALRTVAILVDDSYSMGDLSADGGLGTATAFDRGRLVVERIVAELAESSGQQELAIGRFSRLRPGESGGFDVPRQVVSPRLVQEVRTLLEPLRSSWAGAVPSDARSLRSPRSWSRSLARSAITDAPRGARRSLR